MGLDPNNLPASFRDKMVVTATPSPSPVKFIPHPSTNLVMQKSTDEEKLRRFTINTSPVPAPRMTKRDAYRVTDKYPRRPCVRRYFDYKDAIQRVVGDLPIVPDELLATFHFPMPDSWSKKKRQEMVGQPHRQRPDGDNCLKAIQDAMFLEDGGVWKGAFEKRWGVHGRVEIEMRWV